MEDSFVSFSGFALKCLSRTKSQLILLQTLCGESSEQYNHGFQINIGYPNVTTVFEECQKVSFSIKMLCSFKNTVNLFESLF